MFWSPNCHHCTGLKTVLQSHALKNQIKWMKVEELSSVPRFLTEVPTLVCRSRRMILKGHEVSRFFAQYQPQQSQSCPPQHVQGQQAQPNQGAADFQDLAFPVNSVWSYWDEKDDQVSNLGPGSQFGDYMQSYDANLALSLQEPASTRDEKGGMEQAFQARLQQYKEMQDTQRNMII